MKQNTIDSEYTEFSHYAKWFQIRGTIMLAVGFIFLLLCLLRPDASLLNSEQSWLPLLGIFLILIGIATLFDALVSKNGNTQLVNAQIGVGDLVVGGLILFNVGRDADHIALLIAAYLMIKGFMRGFTAYSAKIPGLPSRVLEAVTAIVLGFMASLDWFSSQAWFLSAILSVDIALRGRAILKLGSGLSFRLRGRNDSGPAPKERNKE